MESKFEKRRIGIGFNSLFFPSVIQLSNCLRQQTRANKIVKILLLVHTVTMHNVVHI
jgi:hypothetical protein